MKNLFKPTSFKQLKSLNTVIFATAITTAIGLTICPIGSAKAFVDKWEVTGTGDKVIAADCSNCEEDTGIIMECIGAGLPAKITLNAAAAQKGKDGAISPVSFNVDGQKFTIQAKTIEFGLIGFTPVFNLAPNHPLVSALQSGAKAAITFNGEKSSLSLKGSSAALKKFKTHCQWTSATNTQTQPIPQPTQPAQPTPAPQPTQPPLSQSTVFGVQPGEVHTKPIQQGELWYTSSVTENKKVTSRTLAYAIPETDAIAMLASCKLANPSPYKVQLAIHYGQAKKGDLISVIFNFDKSAKMIRKGFVFVDSSEFAGVNLSLAASDEIWAYLATANSITVGVKGQQSITLPTAGNAASYFVSKCR